MPSSRAFVPLTRALYFQETGDLRRALAESEQSLAFAEPMSDFVVLLPAHRLAGVLCAALGRQEEADHHFRTAIALAERCRFPYELALTRLERARAFTAEREGLLAARDCFARLGATPALLEAGALLATRTAAPAQSLPAGLTEREAEVMRLVAQGLTDKEVAARLFISPRTVDAICGTSFRRWALAVGRP